MKVFNWLEQAMSHKTTGVRKAPLYKEIPEGEDPVFLSLAEQQICQRLFAQNFTFEEGLTLYNSVVADGRKFPLTWEKRILELGVIAYPNRQDMRERLELLRNVNPASSEAEPIPSGGIATSQMQPITTNSGSEPDQSLSRNIVVEAKARLAAACALPTDGLPSHGERWGAYAERIRTAIAALATPVEVLQYAQTKIGFEHRGNIHHEGKFTALYERELAVSFPHFADHLIGFADIDDSAPDTTYEHKGRLISNVLFYLARVVLSCLTHLPAAPRIVLEVGGGYGAPARIWMKNPIRPPHCYLILDMPESLFFADVFLRKEFGDDKVHYVTSSESLPVDILEKNSFILCPLPHFASLQDLPVDLVINTGSLQEMNEAWVDFYKDWLDRQRCCWFYSLNYFAQPVNALWESGNLLSPRLSPAWSARLLRWNPAFVRMQADRDFLEALYEKNGASLNQEESQIILKYLMGRTPSGEVLVELMDLVRCHPDPILMFQILAYTMRIPFAPKEVLWLAETLLHQAINDDDRATVENWRQVLATSRAAGTEAYY